MTECNKRIWCLYSAPPSKNAVSAFQISCKLLPFTSEDSRRNYQMINALPPYQTCTYNFLPVVDWPEFGCLMKVSTMLFYLQILCFYLVWHPSNSKNTYDITRSAALLTPGTEVNVTTGRTTFWVVCLCSFWVQRRTCRKMHERQKCTCQECPLCKILRLQTGRKQDTGVFLTCLKQSSSCLWPCAWHVPFWFSYVFLHSLHHTQK